MTKIFMVRHGERLDKVEKYKDEWKNSKRYKENYKDPPLTIKGKNNSKLVGEELKNIGFRKILCNKGYIYSSPLTRCMETAISIIKGLDCEIKIRVEYGLAQTFKGDTIIFEGDQIVKKNYRCYRGKKYISYIDKNLLPKELYKKYGKYIDQSYQSIIEPHEMKLTTEYEYVKILLETLKEIIKNDSLIITHGPQMRYSYLYFTQKNDEIFKFLFSKTSGLNKLIGYEKIDGNWKIIYGPNNDFLKKTFKINYSFFS